MSTRVAVVTGGNKGLGLAIVRALCGQFQGDVYLTARDYGRGQEAVEALAKEGLKSFFQQLDIDDLSSITTAAAFFREKYGGVDVLINNAGIAFKNADTTPFAVQAEVTLKTNFFSTRNVLTHFLPLVKAGGRVVNVSSFVGSQTLGQKITFPRLSSRPGGERVQLRGEHLQNGWPQTAYGVSKTGLTALSMILARRLSKERPNDGILLNACCPGWVGTEMGGSSAPKSPEEGAITPVYLALLPPSAAEPHGKFVSDKEVQTW
ncbi:carbonyl reductase [NADPH] 1-like [Menidia menidia]